MEIQRRHRFGGYKELCLRHLSFKVPKGQITGRDTEHTVAERVMAENKDL